MIVQLGQTECRRAGARAHRRVRTPTGQPVTSSNQLKMHVDTHSLRVEYCGEPTAVRGRLCGTVKPIDWEFRVSGLRGAGVKCPAPSLR